MLQDKDPGKLTIHEFKGNAEPDTRVPVRSITNNGPEKQERFKQNLWHR
jgi:hypothetical protein